MRPPHVIIGTTVALLFSTALLFAQSTGYDGLHMGLGSLSRLSHAKTRSISPENFTGEKGKGGMATEGTGARAARGLGQGWKVSPSVKIDSGQTFTLAQITGPGAVQHIWMTPTGTWRFSILRVYWDGEEEPSVEVPVGDFFANGWGTFAEISSLPVCVSPGSAFNSYWEMPFRKSCRITMQNLDNKAMYLYYQITYTLTDIPADAGYFHAQFRRVNPLPYKSDYTILDGVKGWGHYAGTYLAWGVNTGGWWGEGEIQFFIDGDGKFPTICGTGTEDYFCGSYGFPESYSTPFAGTTLPSDFNHAPPNYWSLYRWHIPDAIAFDHDLKVKIQALGWGPDGKYK